MKLDETFTKPLRILWEIDTAGQFEGTYAVPFVAGGAARCSPAWSKVGLVIGRAVATRKALRQVFHVRVKSVTVVATLPY